MKESRLRASCPVRASLERPLGGNRSRKTSGSRFDAARRVATDVKEDRPAGPEGSELLVAVSDAPRSMPRRRVVSASAPGGHDQERTAPCPGSQPPFPIPSVAPARRRSCLDPAQHGELGPVQLAQHGHGGEAACRGLVRGRQVVQMEQVGGARVGAREQAAPGSDEPFVGGMRLHVSRASPIAADLTSDDVEVSQPWT
jgi:hypothetical protein